MTPEQLTKLVAYLDRLFDFGPDKKAAKVTQPFLDARTKDEQYVAGARERLVEYGLPADRVARFPADQVILLDEKRKYEERRDDEIKLMRLPMWEIEAHSAGIRRLR